jgi:hypothetical protein
MKRIKFNVTGDGVTTGQAIIRGGAYNVHASGTPNGATITIQQLPIGGSTYKDVVDSSASTLSFTGEAIKGLIFTDDGSTFRTSTSGAGGSTNMNITFSKVEM